jgi:hypothetical protein
MSVIGELSRYVDDLIVELDRSPGPHADALRDVLVTARPRHNGELSASAEQILGALEQSGLVDRPSPSTPEEFAPGAREAAEALETLCRIVIGG